MPRYIAYDDYGMPYDPFDPVARRLVRDNAKWVDPRNTNEKSTHPYSYSEFFHFGSREIIKQPGVHGEYSDRIFGWDYEKAQRLAKEHIGMPWERAGADRLSKFLSAFHGRDLRVVACAEGCNASNGYPYYVVWYKEVKSVPSPG